MDYSACIQQLRRHAQVIRQLVEGLDDGEARRRPSDGDWSVLEVVNHLYDEEREDFRQRFDYLLHRRGEDWPPIDPEAWVAARRYNDRELAPSLHSFLEERERSIAWLAELGTPDLDAFEPHPAGGEFRAGDMLAAWVAHDLLHLRQLIELKHFLLTTAAAPYSPRYAGPF